MLKCELHYFVSPRTRENTEKSILSFSEKKKKNMKIIIVCYSNSRRFFNSFICMLYVYTIHSKYR